jgi:hypothetical protein
MADEIMKPTYDVSAMRLKVAAPANDLRNLLMTLPDHEAITDTFDYILGALYGLSRAIETGFVDRSAGWHSTYRPNLPQYVERILKNETPHERWLAGFFFNSAIQRMAASFDRIPKLLGASGPNARSRMEIVSPQKNVAWDGVYEEVNAFKHDIEGRASGRTVTLEQAIAAFVEIVQLLKANERKLALMYSKVLPDLGPSRVAGE